MVARPPSSAALPPVQAVTAASWVPGGTCRVMRRVDAACVCPTWWAPNVTSVLATTGSWPAAGAASHVPATRTTPSAPSATRYTWRGRAWAPQQGRAPAHQPLSPLRTALLGLSKVRLGCFCPPSPGEATKCPSVRGSQPLAMPHSHTFCRAVLGFDFRACVLVGALALGCTGEFCPLTGLSPHSSQGSAPVRKVLVA